MKSLQGVYVIHAE